MGGRGVSGIGAVGRCVQRSLYNIASRWVCARVSTSVIILIVCCFVLNKSSHFMCPTQFATESCKVQSELTKIAAKRPTTSNLGDYRRFQRTKTKCAFSKIFSLPPLPPCVKCSNSYLPKSSAGLSSAPNNVLIGSDRFFSVSANPDALNKEPEVQKQN